MANRSGGRTLVRAPKRRMFWLGVTGSTSVATGTVTTKSAVSESALETIPNPTLIRVRGEIIIHPSSIAAAGATAVIGMGLIIQSSRAVTAGVVGMPTPVSEIGSDWLWHKMSIIDVQSAITVEDGITQNVRFDVDGKAMRKFDLNQALQFNSENTGISGTLTAEIVFAFRFLFKA